MRARNRLGIAIDAIIRMIATTINSSMSENPLCFRFRIMPPSEPFRYPVPAACLSIERSVTPDLHRGKTLFSEKRKKLPSWFGQLNAAVLTRVF